MNWLRASRSLWKKWDSHCWKWCKLFSQPVGREHLNWICQIGDPPNSLEGMNQCKLTELKLPIHHAKLSNKKSKTPSKHVAHLLSKKEKYPEIISQILATLFRLQVSSGCSALGISLTGERWKSLYNHKWIQVQQGLVKGRQWSTAT